MRKLVAVWSLLGASMLFASDCRQEIHAAGSRNGNSAIHSTPYGDDAAFLRAIALDPSDFNLRYVYAGWLEEHDRPASAEILRIGDVAQRALFGQERQDDDEARWKALFLEALREWRSTALGQQLLRSGRIDGFTSLGLPVFRPNSTTALFALSNTISELVTALDLSRMSLSESEVRSLRLKRWSSLTALKLSGNDLPASVVTTLDEAPFAGQLAALDLSDNPTSDRGATALAKAKNLQSLRHVRLERTRLGADGARALARATGASQWESLELGDNALESAGVEALVGGRTFAKLRLLDLSRNGVEEAGFQALGNATTLPALEALLLDGNRGVRALFASATVEPLTYLSLASTALSNAEARELAASSNLKRLRYLNVQGNRLDDESIELVVQSPALAALTTFEFEDPFRRAASPEVGKRVAEALATRRDKR